jgi:hypothetical protein
LQHFLRAGFCFLSGFLVLVIILVGGKTAWNDLGQVDFCLQQSAQGGQKVVEAASEELKELYRQIFIPITENLEGSGGLL